jgi:sulfate adenylyltransferase
MLKFFLRVIPVLLIFSNLISHDLTLTKRQLCDLELLLVGGFSPLQGFLNKKDYDRVVHEMRLSDDTVWPMPITLDISEDLAKKLNAGDTINLKGLEGHALATLHVEDVWKPNKLEEAQNVYGTTGVDHPGVSYLMYNTKDYYVGGKIEKIALPKHYDFNELRKTPEELKNFFKEKGITKIVAFQTRNPMHRAHLELTQRAAKEIGGHLLIHPAVGLTKPGDVDHFTRVKCYKKLMNNFPEGMATLSLLPISMRMAGPREALWHAIIRKNYGATHFIVGRDHAGPGKDKNGNDFYGPYDAQELVKKYENEIGIKMVPFKEMVYVPSIDQYKPIDEISPDTKTLNISGTQLRKMLNDGQQIPEWFTYPQIVEELRKVYPVKSKQGFTIFFTGLSGSGKSTLANALSIKLMEIQNRPITILDGDIVRTNLSSELNFSKEHRSINIRRIGFVANEITKNGGIAICAPIAPYESDRAYNRSQISENGGYIEVYVSTPLDTCIERDEKGLYAKAKKGLIPNFTGISDPYEIPTKPEFTIDTTKTNIDNVVDSIIEYLKKEGFLA